MRLIETGMTVKLREGVNTYFVESADDKYARLVCVAFIHQEDLGDQIFCTRQDQAITIAQFHSWNYVSA